jgi:uncharacterized OB-fold protein
MSVRSNENDQQQNAEVTMRCPRCGEAEVPQGLYCMKCGYIPDWRGRGGQVK